MYYRIKPAKENVTHYLHLITTINKLCEQYGSTQLILVTRKVTLLV